MSRPQKMADVLSQLVARRSYGRQQAANNVEAAWSEAAGKALASQSRVGSVRRGALEVIVANSALVQELTYQKKAIVHRLAELLPDQKIADLRVRVGAVE